MQPGDALFTYRNLEASAVYYGLTGISTPATRISVQEGNPTAAVTALRSLFANHRRIWLLANPKRAKIKDVSFIAIITGADRLGRCVDVVTCGTLSVRLYDQGLPK